MYLKNVLRKVSNDGKKIHTHTDGGDAKNKLLSS